MVHSVVVVESPAKAKTINRYLGNDFVVLASYGHVRDLVAKEGAVDYRHGFQMNYQPIVLALAGDSTTTTLWTILGIIWLGVFN